MAVHEDLQGITVSVSMNGKPMREYHAENDEVEHEDPKAVAHQDERTVTRYIECVEGQTFSVDISVKRPYRLKCDALSFELYVDGKWIDTEVMCDADYKTSNKNFNTQMKGLSVKTAKGMVLRPFKFTKIKIAAEKASKHTIREQKRELAGVGEIELQIDRRQIIKGYQDEKVKYRDMQDLGVDYSKEFQPKPLVPAGKTHGSTFGKAKPREKTKYIHTKIIDRGDFPLLIFKFKYRSKESLQALLVIPRSPQPKGESESESESDSQSETEDEPAARPKIDGLTSAQTSQLQKLLRSFQRPNDNAEGSRKKVKREAVDGLGFGRRVKKPKKMAGKVTIDLTHDDSEDERADRKIIELD